MNRIIILATVFALISCNGKIEKKENSTNKPISEFKIGKLVFDGTNQVSFEKSYERILEKVSEKEQEELKDAVGMLLIFGTGPLDDEDEIKWKRLRDHLNGKTRLEALEYIREKAKNDYE